MTDLDGTAEPTDRAQDVILAALVHARPVVVRAIPPSRAVAEALASANLLAPEPEGDRDWRVLIVRPDGEEITYAASSEDDAATLRDFFNARAGKDVAVVQFAPRQVWTTA